MPPGVYSACPLPTPCEETPAPLAPHPAPWHLESMKILKKRYGLPQPGLARRRTKPTSPFCCFVTPLNVLLISPGCCPHCPSFPRSPRAASALRAARALSLHTVPKAALSHPRTPQWGAAKVDMAQLCLLPREKGGYGGTRCAGTKGFAVWTEAGHPSRGANCAAKRKSGIAQKGKESRSLALAWGQ